MTGVVINQAFFLINFLKKTIGSKFCIYPETLESKLDVLREQMQPYGPRVCTDWITQWQAYDHARKQKAHRIQVTRRETPELAAKLHFLSPGRVVGFPKGRGLVLRVYRSRGQRHPMVTVLRPGGSISGMVTGLASNGAVFPAVNATVYLIRPDGSEATETYAGDGSYTIPGIAPGKYTLRFEPQGDTTDFVPQWLGNKSSQATARTITVKAGKSLTGIDLTMPSTTLASAVPTISGNPIVGRTLHAHAGAWGPAPVTFTYQWSQNGTPISGATASTYVVAEADAASTFTVAVTGSKPGYHSTTTVSAPTDIVTGGTLTTAIATVSGVAQVGGTLTVDPGAWGPSPTLTFQWFHGSTAIAGATGTSYVVDASDAGSNLRVAVTGTQTGYTTVTVKSDSIHIPR